jgi:hypothetical protein
MLTREPLATRTSGEERLHRLLAGLARASVLLLGAALTLALFFRGQTLGHFGFLFGDRYDGVIETTVLEHWFNVLRGLEWWSDTSYFYPYHGTLGYNDGYFIYGLIYSVFRAGNIDPWLSSELVNISVKAIGYFGFYLFCRDVIKIAFPWSVLGAIVFSLANNTALHAIHAQTLTVAFAPLMGWIVFRFVDALSSQCRPCVTGWGIFAALFYSAWLMTGFYMA